MHYIWIFSFIELLYQFFYYDFNLDDEFRPPISMEDHEVKNWLFVSQKKYF